MAEKGKKRQKLKELARRGGTSVAKRMKEKTTKWLLVSDALAAVGGYMEGRELKDKPFNNMVDEGWAGMTRLEAAFVAAHVGGWLLNKPEIQTASAGGVGHVLWRKSSEKGLTSKGGGRPPKAGMDGESIEGEEETSGSVEVEG